MVFQLFAGFKQLLRRAVKKSEYLQAYAQDGPSSEHLIFWGGECKWSFFGGGFQHREEQGVELCLLLFGRSRTF